MTQSMLWGCQAIFEKILTILKEFEIKEDFVIGELDETEQQSPDLGEKIVYQLPNMFFSLNNKICNGIFSSAVNPRKGESTSSSVNHLELETGPKLVDALKKGAKVVRGRDWKWEDQDGHPRNEGLVLSSPEDGWVRVRWPSGVTNSYRYILFCFL